MKNNLKYKDTLFRYFFKQKENFIYLYKELSGKDLSPDEVEFYDTSSLFVNKELQNDVSFLTKDNKFIILVEHQSTKCKNMALRLLIYYIEIINIYIANNNLNLFSNTAVKIPSADFYVAYNGDAKLEDTEQLLEDNFNIDLGRIKVSVGIKNINYSNLKDENKNNFVGYAFFVDCIKKYIKLDLPLEVAFKKAKEDCINNGYLADYVNRKEFLPMVANLFSYEREIAEKAIEENTKNLAKMMLINFEPIDKIKLYTKLTDKQLEELEKEILVKNIDL